MAPTGGFEPLACRLGGGRSILLSYVGIYHACCILTQTAACVNYIVIRSSAICTVFVAAPFLS